MRELPAQWRNNGRDNARRNEVVSETLTRFVMAVMCMFAALVSMAFLLHSVYIRWHYMTFAFTLLTALCVILCMIVLGL